MSKASVNVGDVVLCKVDVRQNNGSPFAPALVVNNVDSEDGHTVLNLRVMTDGDDVRLVRGVRLLSDKEAEAEDAPAVYAKKR